MDDNKIQSLQEAGKVAAIVHEKMSQAVKPGCNVLELEKIVANTIAGAGMKPTFKGYKGFPAASCISLNDQIVHGIPVDRVIEEGDVVAVDIGITHNGWIVDTARTHIAGSGTIEARNLIATAELALAEAIKHCVDGAKVGDIGATVERIVTENGFFVARDLTGHGVGRTLQEPPSIPNFGRAGTGPTLKNGMTLAIEPIITTKETDIGLLSDGWTIIALEGGISAQVEDTIMITPNGPLVLTR